MMLEQMFKDARRDRHAQIGVFRTSPPQGERPHYLRLAFDRLGHIDDGSPSKVNLSLGGGRAWKKSLSSIDGFLGSQCVS